MKKIYFTLILVLSTTTTFATKDSLTLFSIAIQKNIKTYINYSNKYYNKREYQKATFLFDSLVNKTLIGTKFDDFSFSRINKKRIQLSTIQLPTIIFTYSSWCIIEKGEIPALNKLAIENKDKIKIIVVFWDEKKNMKKIGNQFNSEIEVCYAHQNNNEDLKAIELLKNTLGFPTTYFLDSNRNLISLKKRSLKPIYKIDLQTSTESCFASYNQEINSLLITKENIDIHLAKN